MGVDPPRRAVRRAPARGEEIQHRLLRHDAMYRPETGLVRNLSWINTRHRNAWSF